MDTGYATVDVDTSVVSAADRIDYWSVHSRMNQGDMRLSFVSPQQFAGTMCVQRGGGFQFVDATADAVDYIRTRRQALCDDYGAALLIVSHGADVVISHGDNEIGVPCGRLGLLDMGRPLCVSIPSGTRVWAIGVPGEYVPRGTFRDNAPPLLGAGCGSTAAVLALSRTISDHSGCLTGHEFTEISARSMELLNLALHIPSRAEQSQSAVLAHTARSYIAQRSSDPRLTSDSVAVHLGCSRRKLEYSLRSIGAPAPARLIADTRVERAYRRLTDPQENASISEIAYASGFDALSTFHRAFARRFGRSPTAVRRRQQRSPGPSSLADDPHAQIGKEAAQNAQKIL
ncbi:AraC family transcriptional regulator [Nocardia jejuensis]|uniref:AraC family transcriptional regulator n=1 Tax=Nocardia jejuensis TaxID=328049 RepID=UPI000AC469CF|nr:AraC family transcriptional regulator [Nocardia jejuensis]